MTTDSSWDDYLISDTSADTGTTDFTGSSTTLPEPVAGAVETHLDQAVADQEWSDWHADVSDSWSQAADGHLQNAADSVAAGFDPTASLEAADRQYSLAADEAGTASDYAAATDYSVDAAAAEISAYDSTSGYDSGSSFDTGFGAE
ncbi:hypothetical protein O7621_18025 [Solwaraspora sp. WMMD937]|uniref:hypothetical protein n=1 Tax=Solwaraspora sp. WMMD937 TaxID=3016090 RepID=UPI00249A8274|nr:hypothetical protein [Solwaraspora sp. WMMD937]WFE19823.1 hypothetical protein O7621_18025 [Solwaraspora sp. WMMD937]